MKKLTGLLTIIFCCTVFAGAKKIPSFTIHGVSGGVLENVQNRLMELEKIQPLSELHSTELEEQIQKAVKPFGYFESRSELSRAINHPWSIVIHKGPQVRIASVHIKLIGEGFDNSTLITLSKAIPIHAGDPLNTESYKEFKLKLISTAERLGYLHTSFPKAEILVDIKKKEAQIELIFDTGPLYYFGQVQFDPTNINPQLLHRFVPFKPGQFYSTKRVMDFNKAPLQKRKIVYKLNDSY